MQANTITALVGLLVALPAGCELFSTMEPYDDERPCPQGAYCAPSGFCEDGDAPELDGGPRTGGGELDAGYDDAGAVDGGAGDDAGYDAGLFFDAGHDAGYEPGVDSGQPLDGGYGAGNDAGHDAGRPCDVQHGWPTTAYSRRIPLCLEADVDALAAGTLVRLTLDRASMPESEPNGDDVRVVVREANGDFNEMPRRAVKGQDWAGATTEIAFELSAPIAQGDESAAYAIYYGNDSLPPPPTGVRDSNFALLHDASSSIEPNTTAQVYEATHDLGTNDDNWGVLMTWVIAIDGSSLTGELSRKFARSLTSGDGLSTSRDFTVRQNDDRTKVLQQFYRLSGTSSPAVSLSITAQNERIRVLDARALYFWLPPDPGGQSATEVAARALRVSPSAGTTPLPLSSPAGAYLWLASGGHREGLANASRLSAVAGSTVVSSGTDSWLNANDGLIPFFHAQLRSDGPVTLSIDHVAGRDGAESGELFHMAVPTGGFAWATKTRARRPRT